MKNANKPYFTELFKRNHNHNLLHYTLQTVLQINEPV
jgi:hypothetical protein